MDREALAHEEVVDVGLLQPDDAKIAAVPLLTVGAFRVLDRLDEDPLVQDEMDRKSREAMPAAFDAPITSGALICASRICSSCIQV